MINLLTKIFKRKHRGSSSWIVVIFIDVIVIVPQELDNKNTFFRFQNSSSFCLEAF